MPLFQHVMVGTPAARPLRRRPTSTRPPGSSRRARRSTTELRPGRPRRLGQQPRCATAARRARASRARRSPPASATAAGSGSPSRVDVVDRLDREGLLPAIVFIFSRVGCDAAVTQCLGANLRLTTPDERDEIYAFVEEHCRHLPDDDLHVLGYHDFLDGLTRGVAAHHAGMLPTFKECVEELYVRGLCKVVFATETLALGINMPARTVVIEKLTQVERRDPRRHHAGGVHPADRPGRAPRPRRRGPRRRAVAAGDEPARGGRPRLHPHLPAALVVPAVVQHGRQPRAPVRPASAPASCSSSRSRSSRPTRPSSGWPGSCARARTRSTGYAEAATCHLGDFMEYAALRRTDLRRREGRRPGPHGRPPRGGAGVAGAAQARRRDRGAGRQVRRLRRGGRPGHPATRARGPYVVTADRQARRLAHDRLPDAGGGDDPAAGAARLQRPQPADAARPRLGPARRAPTASHRLRRPASHRAGDGPRDGRHAEREIDRLRAELKAHPCHAAAPTARTTPGGPSAGSSSTATPKTLKRRVEQRTNTVARQFDRVCEVLTALDYLDGDTVTERGRHLRRIYSDMDLRRRRVPARRASGTTSTPSELAAALSVAGLRGAPGRRRVARRAMPGGRCAGRRSREMVRLWGELDALEREHQLDFLREPDLGFAWAAYRWAEGDDLDDVLGVSGPGGRRLRALDEAAARPRRPGRRRRRRRTAARDRARGRRRAAPRRRRLLASSTERPRATRSAWAAGHRVHERAERRARTSRSRLDQPLRVGRGRAGAPASGQPRSRSRATATTCGATAR